MNKYKICLILYIILLIIYWCIGTRFIYKKKFNHYKIKNLYLDEIKSGDTFMIAYQQYYRIFGDSIIGLNFTHSSTAYWENGILYFIEYAYYTEKWNGIMKIPYHMWFKFNKNAIILVNKLHIKHNEQEERKIINDKIGQFYETYKREDDLDAGFDLSWNRFRQDYRNSKEPLSKFWNKILGNPTNQYKKLNFEEDKKSTCVEITAFLLCESDIIKKNKSVSYLPSKFIGMNGFDCHDNFSFHEHYICDISNFKNL